MSRHLDAAPFVLAALFAIRGPVGQGRVASAPTVTAFTRVGRGRARSRQCFADARLACR